MRRPILKVFKFLGTTCLVFIELLFAFLICLVLYILYVARIDEPQVADISMPVRREAGINYYVSGNNWLRKNEFGIWEMYIEGDDYERGLVYGVLAKELVQKQEEIFVGQINDFVPNSTARQFLRLMIGFFNKELVNNIPSENLREIYGVSRSFSDDYNYISSKYSRILNYHAAHDIGHALNDYSMVGCTSFAVKGEKTADSNLLVGRNFDFYVGDRFAEEKLVLFVNPKKGYKFASYSWAGFTGVVSGMNETGLSVTINASKSQLPTSSKTPISLVVREILQYASTIDEAIAIARKRAVFVSETILVASKKDGKAGLIEKSPGGQGIYFSPDNTLVCSNHYQSQTFASTKENLQNLTESDTRFRYNRTKELLADQTGMTPEDAAKILRNQTAEHNDTLGMGNPRAINQLVAHHSVIFQPQIGRMWVSTTDFQLGRYIAYDLPAFFQDKTPPTHYFVIKADPFVYSQQYQDFLLFKKIKTAIFRFVRFGEQLTLSPQQVKLFIASNGESFQTYESLGNYFLEKKDKKSAARYFRLALTKTLPSQKEGEELKTLLKKCSN